MTRRERAIVGMVMLTVVLVALIMAVNILSLVHGCEDRGGVYVVYAGCMSGLERLP